MNPSRKLLNTACSQCGKVGVKCKGLCNSCYSKQWRGTPYGIEFIKIYNATKQKEANKRYLNKHPKHPKIVYPELCECGEKSIAKGLCHRCYHRDYERKKYNQTPRPIKSNPYILAKKTVAVDKLFESVLSKVMVGFTISEACVNLSIDRTFLYKNISDKQKQELRANKAIYVNSIRDQFIDEYCFE